MVIKSLAVFLTLGFSLERGAHRVSSIISNLVLMKCLGPHPLPKSHTMKTSLLVLANGTDHTAIP